MQTCDGSSWLWSLCINVHNVLAFFFSCPALRRCSFSDLYFREHLCSQGRVNLSHPVLTNLPAVHSRGTCVAFHHGPSKPSLSEDRFLCDMTGSCVAAVVVCSFFRLVIWRPRRPSFSPNGPDCVDIPHGIHSVVCVDSSLRRVQSWLCSVNCTVPEEWQGWLFSSCFSHTMC